MGLAAGQNHFILEVRRRRNNPLDASLARLVKERLAELVVIQRGPKAFKVFQAAGIELVVGVKGNTGDAVKAYLEGKYKTAQEANVEGHWV